MIDVVDGYGVEHQLWLLRRVCGSEEKFDELFEAARLDVAAGKTWCFALRRQRVTFVTMESARLRAQKRRRKQGVAA